ncbi:2Fe-2S iron-sulfur cluster binding domain-containing protein [bacterium]|nr:2Fe-2S iron-sulfur cluster binding domain-containing protein [bacterium]
MENTITVYVTDLNGVEHEVMAPTDMNLSLMEAIRLNELQIKATCGGMAMCATCNVIVNSDHQLPEMKEAEEDMLDEAFVLDVEGSRLSCQIPITPELEGLKVSLGALTGE